MSDKNELAAILELLQSLEDNYQVRDAGEVNFKAAKTGLLQLIALPDIVPAPPAPPAEPIRVEVPVIDPALSAAIDSIGDIVADLMLNKPDFNLDAITAKLTSIESALNQLVTTPPAP